MRKLMQMSLVSSALACCSIPDPGIGASPEDMSGQTDGHVSDSICSISDGMGSIGGGSTESLSSTVPNKELINDAGSGFITDSGTQEAIREVWGGTA